MPRNSSGTYTLPAGNPVVTGTTISSTWANTTLSDIADNITDSLDRSGKGAMLASLHLFDGVIGAPGLSWETEATSGLYRAGAGDFRYSISATDAFRISSQGLLLIAGSAASPSLSVVGDTNTGLFWVGADAFGVSVGGAKAYEWDNSAGTIQGFAAVAGTAAAPFYSFATDVNTGAYSVGADIWGVSTGGVLRFRVAATQAVGVGTLTIPTTNTLDFYFAGAGMLAGQEGVGGELDLAWNAYYNTGWKYRLADVAGRITYQGESAASWSFDTAASGSADAAITWTERLRITAGQVLGGSGTVGAPGFSFISDSDTGIYISSANTMNFVAGGATTFLIDTTQVSIGVNSFTFGTLNAGAMTLNVTNSNSATAGGVASLPATVRGYWTVTINGSTRKIPYYDN